MDQRADFAGMRGDALGIFNAAVQAVLPAIFLPGALPMPLETGRICILAAGKAAGSMARAAEDFYLDQAGLPASRLFGIAVARHGYEQPLRLLESRGAGHPVPDAAGLAATLRLLEIARGMRRDDQVIFLLSGGASANLVAPLPPITLEEKQALTREMLRKGVPIDRINAVRKHISAVKGGRLAASLAPARILTLALSDVPGDVLSAIGSGPTIPDPTTLDEARAVIRDYGIIAPPSVLAALADLAHETPKPDDPLFSRCEARVVARPSDAFAAAVQAAQSRGYQVEILERELEGEASTRGQEHGRIALERAGSGMKTALLSGGELTVTLRGKGRGGPNQEYALALAQALGGAAGIVALAADTDGTDGGQGKASDPAGAFVDPTSLKRAEAAGCHAAAMLAENNSTAFFEAINDLHCPGPTFTNANDLRIILIDGKTSAGKT